MMGEHNRLTPAARIEKKRKVVTLMIARTWLNQWEQANKASKLVDASGQPISGMWPAMPTVKYLWPHDKMLNKYEMKEGNAPSDSDRPEWLRGIPLWIDAAVLIRQITEEVKLRLSSAGMFTSLKAQDAVDFYEHYFGGEKDVAFH